ncbi:MAG: outer membrane protein assembly factor BamA, partial [Bacteroidaceae bacterium]|nr:outer membrane protein assembly factor BamA [Bacteroidaceae bacterium]
MNKILRTLFTLAFGMLLLPSAYAQQDVENPTILYGQQRRLPIGGIKVEGVENYEDYLLIGISGLSIGEQVTLPGDEITAAVKRYWKHGLFSSVRIEAEKIQNDSLYLKIILAARPRVSEININGVRKSEKEDLEEKIGIMKGIQITPNMVDRAKIVIKRYFDDKGFKNAEAEIVQRDDLNKKDQVIVDVNIDKKEKVKVNKIYITGNDHIKTRKFHGNFFSGGLLKKTNEKGFKSLFKTQKFVDEKYAEDKERVIEKYNELGYRDAQIVADSVVPAGE